MPIIQKSSLLKELHFVVWQVLESESQLWQNLNLPKGDIARIQSCRHEKRRLEMLAVRQCLQAFYDKNKPSLSYLANGCPVLSNDHHISVSHSGKMVAIVVSEKQPVGVDIETRSNRIANIAPKFVNDKEASFISPELHIEYLLALWGAKEAIVKLSRNRRLNFKQAIEVQPFKIESVQIKSKVLYRDPKEHQAQLYFQINDNYILTLAYRE